MQLDRADRKLLRAVQEDCGRSAEELGDLCGLSPSTVLRRLKRLRRAGIITAEVAVVDPIKVGRPLLMIVAVRMERENTSVVTEFIARVRNCSAVTQCYFVTGSADYILHISARDMEEFNAVIQDLLVSNPHVRTSETNVVIDRVKVGGAVPIAEPEAVA